MPQIKPLEKYVFVNNYITCMPTQVLASVLYFCHTFVLPHHISVGFIVIENSARILDPTPSAS